MQVLRRSNTEKFYHSWDYSPERTERKKTDSSKVKRHHKSPKAARSSSVSSEDSSTSGSLEEPSSASEELTWLAYLQESMSKEKVNHRIDANGKKTIKSASMDYLIKALVSLDPEEIPGLQSLSKTVNILFRQG
jgi:hypothetical protein